MMLSLFLSAGPVHCIFAEFKRCICSLLKKWYLCLGWKGEVLLITTVFISILEIFCNSFFIFNHLDKEKVKVCPSRLRALGPVLISGVRPSALIWHCHTSS